MQLTYRGLSYTTSTEVSVPQTHQFIYRGVSFNSSLNLVTPLCLKADETESSVKLIYRGLTYNGTSAPVAPYSYPHALNWRSQVA